MAVDFQRSKIRHQETSISIDRKSIRMITQVLNNDQHQTSILATLPSNINKSVILQTNSRSTGMKAKMPAILRQRQLRSKIR
jgi:hypothetical protein